MNDMNKFQRSWLLLKSSLSIIAKNPRLLVFPIVIFSLTVIIGLFFLAPAVLQPTGYSITQAEHWQAVGDSLFTHSDGGVARHGSQIGLTRGAMAYLAFLYLVSMFLATFFNVAFYSEILAALSGQPVSIVRGLRFAGTKLKSILLWALFAGLVGLIIKTIEQRLDFVGRIITRLIGLAWSIASVFVIPVIVTEEQSANPVEMLKKSAGILKRTWGEALIGYVGLAFANAMIMIGSLVLLAGTLAASIALNNYWLIGVTGLLWIVAIVSWGYLMNVASQIYKSALYLYAAKGVIPAPYSQEMLEMAWKFKKQRA